MVSVTAFLYVTAWAMSMVSFCRYLCNPAVTDRRVWKTISKYTEENLLSFALNPTAVGVLIVERHSMIAGKLSITAVTE